jgi:hypothetical protein
MRTLSKRYHPAGTWLRSKIRRKARRRQGEWVTMRGGNLVRSLTPRQAVVWLMHLDAVADRLPSTVQPHFTIEARGRLARALRARVAGREGLTRRKHVALGAT